MWKYSSFDDALAGVYGRTIDQLSDEWQYWMRQHYYPAVASQPPLAITARKLTDVAIKPTAYQLPGDSAPSFLFFSPASGYTTIYAQDLAGHGRRPVVQGERSEQFESFHFFESRIDVNAAGVAAFSSKYAERDALFFWDLRKSRVVGRYQFAELVSILSPAWAPDGKSVVFSGLSESGYSDLYRLWLARGDSGVGRLERLTSDRYEDLDPTISPDGRIVAFSSDRTPFGRSGAHNLFALDLASGAIHYLTYGNWRDETPRWAADRIYFTSDRDSTFQVYSIDAGGTGRRETRTLNGAFDPQLVPGAHGGLLFGGFADLTFNIYVAPPLADAGTFTLAAAESLPAPSWTWGELSHPQYARADGTPYERKFSLDFAAGDAAIAPGLGSAQGAVFVFSDLLSDHQLFFSLSSFQTSGFGSLVDNISGSAFYLNQSRRINWGVGAFRQRGLFYEGDFNTLFEERSYGAFAQVRYPLNRFRRIVGEYRIERSDRLDLTTADVEEPRRIGWLASNYLTYVKDNTLWLPTGPIDGERYNFTGGLVNDLSHGRFDSWLVSVDWRKYLRTSLHSAVALRAQGYTSGGERPRPISIGGSWGLRGFPQYGYVAGTRAWLVNAEYRFPILDFLTIGFPFGAARFPGVQGALFVDYGRAWSRTTSDRSVLGSSGLGLRMPIGPPLVLRLDLGYRLGRIDVATIDRAALSFLHCRLYVARGVSESSHTAARADGAGAGESRQRGAVEPFDAAAHADVDSVSLALPGRAGQVRGARQRSRCAARFAAIRLRGAAGPRQRGGGGHWRLGAMGGPGQGLSLSRARDSDAVGRVCDGAAAGGRRDGARRRAGRSHGVADCAAGGYARLYGDRQRGPGVQGGSGMAAAREDGGAQPDAARCTGARRKRSHRFPGGFGQV